MPPVSGEPFQGNTIIRVSNGTGVRHFRLSCIVVAAQASNTANDVDHGIVGDDTWTALPGDELDASANGASWGQLTLTWNTTGVLPPPQAYVARFAALIPDSPTMIGTVKDVAVSGDSGSITVPFFFTDDPFNDPLGTPYAGMIELYLEVSNEGGGLNNWGPAYSRGGANDPNGHTYTNARGYVRAPSKIVSHTISNDSVDGPEPALWAYPDQIYGKLTLDHPLYKGSSLHELNTHQASAEIDSETGSNVADGNVITFSATTQAIIDANYAAGDVDLRFKMDPTKFATFKDEHFAFADSGHEAGWTFVDDQQVEYPARFQVDPAVTIENLTLDEPDTTVFNRKEAQGGSFEVHNARSEPVVPSAHGGSDEVRVAREADPDDDEQLATISRVGNVVNFDFVFAASNNIAPADVTGDPKVIVWDDLGAPVIATTPSSRIGYLSSLLDMVDVETKYANNTTTIYNRGESAEITGRLLNRRGEPFTEFTAETFKSVDRGTNAEEETAVINSHDLGTGAFDLTMTFATSGNVAPEDEVGAVKDLRWDDTSGNTTPDDQYGYLSSLLKIISHLQVNDNQLDPALHNPERLQSDLGFYSVKVASQSGAGINGLSLTDHLRDDQDLVDDITRTDTTQTVNGHDGYLPLKAWDSALPGGGWDHWTVGGTYNGNSYSRPRKGEGISDFTLLSLNPNLIAVASGGHDAPGEDGLHWTAGNELLVGCTLFDTNKQRTVAVDDHPTLLDPGGAPLPRAYMIVARFNNATGAAQFYDDSGVWQNVEDHDGNVYLWQLMSIRRSNELQAIGSVGDERTYVHLFSEADTADWGLSNLFFVPVMYQNSTPYSMWGMAGVTGAANQHRGYSVDPVSLGLHGVLGMR